MAQSQNRADSLADECDEPHAVVVDAVVADYEVGLEDDYGAAVDYDDVDDVDAVDADVDVDAEDRKRKVRVRWN